MKRALAIALLLFAPVALHAQNPEGGADSLDAWRTNLNRRLDQDIAHLRAASPSASTASSAAILEVKYEAPSRLNALSEPAPGGEPPGFPAMASLLRAQGLPPSLLGVVAVESGFDSLALSPKGARGLWQLMPATARRFGLVVEPGRDDRLDALKSTLAAAQYLKSLYAQFGNWPLALAAYNTGEQRVEHSLQRLGAHDFWTLSRAAALPDETRRYVPAVLARLNPSTSPLDLALAAPSATPRRIAQTRVGLDESPHRPQVVFATSSPASANIVNAR